MSRAQAVVRDAVPDDALALQSIWLDFATKEWPSDERQSRETRETTMVEQIERSILRFETDPSERLLVALVDGEAVGVAHLRRAPLSPMHPDDAVHVGYLHVLSDFRRRGVGKQLLEAAADWAEEKDSQHIVASVAARNRDANRFLARLGLGQVAVIRASTVASLRAKLASPGQSVAVHVVAARRLTRRASRREASA
jgi:GNAT superfamily N-acetyltransferase